MSFTIARYFFHILLAALPEICLYEEQNVVVKLAQRHFHFSLAKLFASISPNVLSILLEFFLIIQQFQQASKAKDFNGLIYDETENAKVMIFPTNRNFSEANVNHLITRFRTIFWNHFSSCYTGLASLPAQKMALISNNYSKNQYISYQL